MTPDEESTFITLWNQGLPTAEIAQQLQIPAGTARSCAYILQQRGLIRPRPKGGRRVSSRSAPAPARAPAPAPVDSTLPTREAPAITMVAVPELREFINRFSALEARVGALEQATRDPPAPAHAPAPHPQVDIEQWTVRLSKTLIERIKAEALRTKKPPSHVLEELAWKALSDSPESTP